MNNKSDKLIMSPYANVDGANGGVNIKRGSSRVDLYLKNCCVALASAKKFNPDCDVALVTNIDVPNTYQRVLELNGVKIFKIKFDKFNFGKEYAWSLAFFKLRAIDYAVKNLDYEYYSYLDSDVYIQSAYEEIWKECDYSILLYDINHGLQVKDYREFLSEISQYTSSDKPITHYGGEFFAANKKNALAFIEECGKIFDEMKARGFVTTFGDEFTLSLAADKLKLKIKNAAAYVCRFWTGTFRLVSTCYKFNPVVVLHVPNEKEHGILRIYDGYVSKGKLPSSKKVHKIFHLDKADVVTKIKSVVKKILKR